jgi:hypothetical protein
MIKMVWGKIGNRERLRDVFDVEMVRNYEMLK